MAVERLTLGEILAYRAQHTPDRVAFTYSASGADEAETMSYGTLQRHAQAVAALLLNRVGPGSRVLLLFEPGLDFVCALFGCFQAGIVGVSALPPSPKRLHRTVPRLRAVAADAQVAGVLTTAAVRDAAEPLCAGEPALGGIPWIAVGRDATDDGPGVASADPSGLAFIQYTSGSTLAPRGVKLTHANFLANAQVLRRGLGLSSDSRGFSWLPASHDMGLIMGILQPVYLGYPSALMSPLAAIKRPIDWLEGISRFRATVSGAPNFAYELAVRRTTPEQRASLDLSCWEVAFNGAEPVRAQTLRDFAAAFAPYGFRRSSLYPCYGLAEATLMVTGPQLRREPTVLELDARGLERGVVQAPTARARVVSVVGCGEADDRHRVAIVDPESRWRCADGRIGEVWVSGPSVAAGYWRDEGKNAEVFGARIADDECGDGGGHPPNFLRTGDLGFLHRGELFIVGRRKDLIILNGRNHHPHDIELSSESAHRHLRSHCSAAFAIENRVGRAGAAIVLEIDPAPAEELPVIMQSVRRRVVDQLEVQLDQITLVAPGTVPKTTSGKIQRQLCRRHLTDGKLTPIAEWRARHV